MIHEWLRHILFRFTAGFLHPALPRQGGGGGSIVPATATAAAAAAVAAVAAAAAAVVAVAVAAPAVAAAAAAIILEQRCETIPNNSWLICTIPSPCILFRTNLRHTVLINEILSDS